MYVIQNFTKKTPFTRVSLKSWNFLNPIKLRFLKKTSLNNKLIVVGLLIRINMIFIKEPAIVKFGINDLKEPF